MTRTQIITDSRMTDRPGIMPELQRLLMEFALIGEPQAQKINDTWLFGGDFRSINVSFEVQTENRKHSKLMYHLLRCNRELCDGLIWVEDWRIAIYDEQKWVHVGDTWQHVAMGTDPLRDEIANSMMQRYYDDGYVALQGIKP
jgi:hypothetical protein